MPIRCTPELLIVAQQIPVGLWTSYPLIDGGLSVSGYALRAERLTRHDRRQLVPERVSLSRVLAYFLVD